MQQTTNYCKKPKQTVKQIKTFLLFNLTEAKLVYLTQLKKIIIITPN